MSLETLQRDWQQFGERDPLWAVVSHGDARGGKWDEEAFFATGREEVAVILAFAKPTPGGRCLDFGCGVGRLTLPLAHHFAEAVGVDIAPAMIEAAGRYRGDETNVSYVLNETEDLGQFADGSFDFINSSIVLQHMAPEFALSYLREFARLLSPGGKAVFTLPSEPSGSLKGHLYRVLPHRVINAYKRRRDGATMEMNAIPIANLIASVERFGMTVDGVRLSTSAGPNWVAYRYLCTR